MKKMRWLIAVLAVTFGLTASDAIAADEPKLISINFGPTAKKPDLSALGSTGSNTWNLFPSIVTGTKLKFYDGTDSDVTITKWVASGTGTISLAENSFYESGAAKPGYLLMRNYTYTYASVGSFTFSGIEPGQYQIYIYTNSSNVMTNKLSATASTSVGTPYTAQIIGDDGSSYSTFVEGKNYLVLPVTVGADGALTLTYTGNDLSSDDIGRIQGLELQPVPEASTLTMLMIGGAIIMIYIRRKSNEESDATAA